MWKQKRALDRLGVLRRLRDANHHALRGRQIVTNRNGMEALLGRVNAFDMPFERTYPDADAMWYTIEALRGDALKLSRRDTLATVVATAALGPSSAGAAKSQGRDRRSQSIRLVILDVGGTIVEDRGDVPTALCSAMGAHGVTVTPAEVGQFRGASKREIVGHFVARQGTLSVDSREALVAAIYEEFRERLIEIYRTVPPITGAEVAMRSLRQRGYLLATNTGFDREIAHAIFRRLGWEDLFVATICSDDVAQGRPAPFMIFHAMESARVNSVAEVMAVGDTPLDLWAGTNSGLAVVGVL